jgi:hypothetical protein
MKFFPIQGGMIRKIPWGMVSHLEERAQKNHGQTLDRLAQRSGLDSTEMLKLLNDEDLFPFVTDPDADHKIMIRIVQHINGINDKINA